MLTCNESITHILILILYGYIHLSNVALYYNISSILYTNGFS